MLAEAEATDLRRGRGLRRGPPGRRASRGALDQGGTPLGEVRRRQGGHRGRGGGQGRGRSCREGRARRGPTRTRSPRWPRRPQKASPEKPSPAQLHRSRRPDDEDRDGSFHYAYNAQAVVDEESQVIVSTALVQEAGRRQTARADDRQDERELAARDRDRPEGLLADAGYCSKDNLETPKRTTEVLVATGRLKHGEKVPSSPRGRIPKNATSPRTHGTAAENEVRAGPTTRGARRSSNPSSVR